MASNFTEENSVRTPSRFAAARKRLSSKSFASFSDYKSRSRTDPTVFHPHPFLGHPNPLGCHPVSGSGLLDYAGAADQRQTSLEAPVLPPIDVGTTNIGTVLCPKFAERSAQDDQVNIVDAVDALDHCDEEKNNVRVGSAKSLSISSKYTDCASSPLSSQAGTPVIRLRTLTKAYTTMGINVAQDFSHRTDHYNGKGKETMKENVPLKTFGPNGPFLSIDSRPQTPKSSAKPKPRRARSMANLTGMSRGPSEPVKCRIPSALNLPPSWGVEHDRFITYLATHAPRASDCRVPPDSAPYYTLPQIQQLIREVFPWFGNGVISTSTIDRRLQMLEISGNDYFQVAYRGYELTSYEWGRYV